MTLLRKWRIPPLGMLALAAFVLCAATGLMLAPAFQPSAPLDSLALLLLKNPAAVLVRALHYWSAQAFLVFTIAHTLDHLLRRTEARLRFPVWLRLGLSVPVIVGAMLSGFLLRADPSSAQALRILRSLLSFVPLAGDALARLLTGAGADLSTLYLHHVCTATVVIWLISFDHARRIMPTARAVWWTLPPVLLLSLLLVPGLEWAAWGVELGPWYLAGLQELLHWLPQPQAVLLLACAAGALFIALPLFPNRSRSRLKRALAAAALAYAALTAAALLFRGEGWQLQPPSAIVRQSALLSYRSWLPPPASLVASPVPSVDGRREGCLACHSAMSGFAPAHEARRIGCAVCHLGHPFTLDKSLAHSGMTRTPGNLSLVNRTCASANCHGEIATRLRSSLMNTMSGVVAVDRFVFAENPDRNARFDVAALGHSPADSHLRTLCASCHIGQEKSSPAPIDEQSRGGGCSACHLYYSPEASAELHRPPGAPAPPAPLHHPEISLHIRPEACFGCHSRSGRIATNYEGWHETLLDEASAKSQPGWPAQFRQLSDGRIFVKRPADVHFEAGMTCIDCHLASEVMGGAGAHERDAVKISCADCHTAAPASAPFARLDSETQVIASLRHTNEPGRAFLLTASGPAYPNAFLDPAGRPALALASSSKILHPKPPAPACARFGSPHQRLECGACHSSWAPQCIQCHTSFDPSAVAWDHLAGKDVHGAWQEQPADFLSDAPALGVQQINSPAGPALRIATFIPGMILTLGPAPSAPRPRFLRLFAPSSPHTTVTRARDCRSCHANPAALGYGRGRLAYVLDSGPARWQFTPAYPASPADGLPLDAWIPFLQEPPANTTTRNNARPFTLREQQDILLVGACLQCHDEKQPRLAAVFANFRNVRASLSPRCRLPAWPVP